MKEYISNHKVSRIWLNSSIVFIVLSTIVFLVLFAKGSIELRNETRDSFRKLVENKIVSELPAIADDVYLGLNTLPLRTESYSALLGSHASISLEVQRSNVTSMINETPSWDKKTKSGVDSFVAPLKFGSINLGTVKANLEWRKSLLALSIEKIIYQSIAPLAAFFCFWFGAFFYINRKIVNPLLVENTILARDSGIAKATTMLAHDIRRPFSTLIMALNRLSMMSPHGKDLANEVADIRRTVGRAYSQTNNILLDVLDISSTEIKLTTHFISVKLIISSAIQTIFGSDRDSNVSFSYELFQQSMLKVDSSKIERVFFNIIENARHAMQGQGELWFKAREALDVEMIEITIGNSGSFIPEDVRLLIFDSFFSAGKPGGTGLGLTICKKFIVAHGGTIRCESDIEKGTEFIFTLPSAKNEIDHSMVTLPQSTQEIINDLKLEVEKNFLSQSHNSNKSGATSDVEHALESQCIAAIKIRAKNLGRPISIAVVDDDPIYLRAVLSLIDEDLHGNTIVAFDLESYHEAISVILTRPFDLIVTDLELGDGSGLDIVREAKSYNPEVIVCVHSNHSDASRYREALATGADAFLPKPMGKIQLLKLLI
jgi:signal transduction histidine kinase/CheY-like chemotaxis protein